MTWVDRVQFCAFIFYWKSRRCLVCVCVGHHGALVFGKWKEENLILLLFMRFSYFLLYAYIPNVNGGQIVWKCIVEACHVSSIDNKTHIHHKSSDIQLSLVHGSFWQRVIYLRVEAIKPNNNIMSMAQQGPQTTLRKSVRHFMWPLLWCFNVIIIKKKGDGDI